MAQQQRPAFNNQGRRPHGHRNHHQQRQQGYPPQGMQPIPPPREAVGSCVWFRRQGQEYGFLRTDDNMEVWVSAHEVEFDLQPEDRVAFTITPHLRDNVWQGKFQAVQVRPLAVENDPYLQLQLQMGGAPPGVRAAAPEWQPGQMPPGVAFLNYGQPGYAMGLPPFMGQYGQPMGGQPMGMAPQGGPPPVLAPVEPPPVLPPVDPDAAPPNPLGPPGLGLPGVSDDVPPLLDAAAPAPAAPVEMPFPTTGGVTRIDFPPGRLLRLVLAAAGCPEAEAAFRTAEIDDEALIFLEPGFEEGIVSRAVGDAVLRVVASFKDGWKARGGPDGPPPYAEEPRIVAPAPAPAPEPEPEVVELPPEDPPASNENAAPANGPAKAPREKRDRKKKPNKKQQEALDRKEREKAEAAAALAEETRLKELADAKAAEDAAKAAAAAEAARPKTQEEIDIERAIRLSQQDVDREAAGSWSDVTKKNRPNRKAAKQPAAPAATVPACETFVLKVEGQNVLEGCKLYKDAIDEKLEQKLAKVVDDLLKKDRNGTIGGHPLQGGRRRSLKPNATRFDVQAGPMFDDYKNQRLIADGDVVNGAPFVTEPLPDVAGELHQALVKRGAISKKAPPPEIFLANVYEKGQYTLNHTDAKYIKRPLVVTTLLSDGDMVFANRLQRTGKDEPFFEGKGCESAKVLLPRRSTVVLTGAAADKLQHAIDAVKARRISILLRNG